MRLFGLLGGGWSINFSQQTPSGIRAFDAGSRRSSGFQLGKALSHGPGVFIGLLRRPGLSRARLEPEIERCRPSSETLRDDGDEALAVPLLVLLGSKDTVAQSPRFRSVDARCGTKASRSATRA